MSAAPAALAGLGDARAASRPGYDADLVVWDPDAELRSSIPSALQQRHKLTPYAGRRLRGRRAHDLSCAGERVWDDGRLVALRAGQAAVTTTTFLDLVDLASERLGGAVVAANDEFFAPKEN